MPGVISSYEIYNVDSADELRKVASDTIKLPADFKYDPDYLYILIRIVSSGDYYGPNKNGDYFPTEELENSYETFANAHPFKNHENKNIEGAIGKIITFDWNPVMKTVEILKAIDRTIAPRIVRGFEKGYMTDVSMGCRVPFTVCSVCGNKASKPSEFCEHVKRHRLKYLDNGERVFEINFQPKFHDSSVVMVGAERSAKAIMVLDESDFSNEALFEKTASADNRVFSYTKLSDYETEKVASFNEKKLHPLLKPSTHEKVAHENGLLNKLAAFEKMVTGKIVNIVSEPKELTTADRVIKLVKLMGEGRITQSTSDIAKAIRDVATSAQITEADAFGAFLSLSKLTGNKLFPTEIDAIAKELTVGEDPYFKLSTPKTSTTSDVLRKVVEGDDIKAQLPKLNHPSKIVIMYKKMPTIMGNVTGDKLARLINDVNVSYVPQQDIRSFGMRDFLSIFDKMTPFRSARSENLLSRIGAHLHSGNAIANPVKDAYVDANVMSTPQTVGDILAHIAYHSYNDDYPYKGIDKVAHIINSVDSTPLTKIASMYNGDNVIGSARPQLESYRNEDVVPFLKVAQPIDAGEYNAFNADMMDRYASVKGMSPEQVGMLKAAALFKVAGDDDAKRIQNAYNIHDYALGDFLKFAYHEVDNELDKVASSYVQGLSFDNFDKEGMDKTASHLPQTVRENLVIRSINNLM